jgi:predicted Na+-dependent transporter
MTFEGSLSMNFHSLKNVVIHPMPVIIALIFLHIIMPIWAWGIGHIVFNGDSLTITGIVLGMTIPTGITSFIWVSMKKGNKAVTLSAILIDALLSPIIVPFSLSLMVGQKVEIDSGSMMIGLFYMIVLPSIIGMVLNTITKGKIVPLWKPWLAPISKIFLGIVVALNGAMIAPYLVELNWKLVFIILVVFFIAISGYVFAFLLGKGMKFDQEMNIAFTYICGMRNISAGAVIAISYFPAAVAVPVVVMMLFQQILASLFGSFLDKQVERPIEGKQPLIHTGS